MPPRLGGLKVLTVAVRKAFSSDLLDAAATTDSVVLWTQPAGSVMLGVKMILSAAFVATGLTTATITIGDGSDNDGILIAGTMNLRTDTLGTNYSSRGAYWDSSAEGAFWYANSATDWTGYTTLGVANCSALTQGMVTFIFTYATIV